MRDLQKDLEMFKAGYGPPLWQEGKVIMEYLERAIKVEEEVKKHRERTKEVVQIGEKAVKKWQKAEALNKKLADALEVALDNYDDWADGKLDTIAECMSVLAEVRRNISE